MEQEPQRRPTLRELAWSLISRAVTVLASHVMGRGRSVEQGTDLELTPVQEAPAIAASETPAVVADGPAPEKVTAGLPTVQVAVESAPPEPRPMPEIVVVRTSTPHPMTAASLPRLDDLGALRRLAESGARREPASVTVRLAEPPDAAVLAARQTIAELGFEQLDPLSRIMTQQAYRGKIVKADATYLWVQPLATSGNPTPSPQRIPIGRLAFDSNLAGHGNVAKLDFLRSLKDNPSVAQLDLVVYQRRDQSLVVAFEPPKQAASLPTQPSLTPTRKKS